MIRTLGYASDEIIDRRSLYFVHQDDHQQVKTDSHNMITGNRTSPYEYRMISKDGQEKWMLETVSFIHYADRPAVLGIAMDISEQKKVEEQRLHLEAQLRQAQKMEAIGTLAGGIAHDFNNILAAIIGYSELVCRRLNGHEREKQYMRKALQACERAKDLIKQILAFSRSDEHKLHPLNITPVIKEAVKLLRASLPATIDIKIEQEAFDDRVMADPTQIHQILMNLCTNAAYAMKEKGGMLTIGLQTKNSLPENTDDRMMPTSLSPSLLEITVSDTGHGIPPAILDKIFDPFFTTKEVGKGTGMGLAVVHGIVKGHGGTIRVESEVSQGTTFYVYLPLTSDIITESETNTLKCLPQASARILLIDDEDILIDMAREWFTELGYHVTAETNSHRALEIFRLDPERFDLVITDMTMPGMTGLQLAAHLVAIKPDIDIILCTGYSEAITSETLAVAGIRHYITKPFTQIQIHAAIQDILAAKKLSPGQASSEPAKQQDGPVHEANADDDKNYTLNHSNTYNRLCGERTGSMV